MSPVRLNGSTSGYTELSAPAVAGNNSVALPTGNGTTYQILRNGATAGSLEFTDKIVSGTAVASTSGTSIDFTGIPSWVKRVTVMFNGVSTNGTSNLLIQTGISSGVVTSGYTSNSTISSTSTASTAGLIVTQANAAAFTQIGIATIANVNSNTWVYTAITIPNTTNNGSYAAGNIALSGTLDRVRITTVNGTDTFDAGSINILYE
jgi:hypothetical protein